MLLGVGLTFLALRAGLGLRRRRQQGAAKVPGSLARHLALARPAVLLGALGLFSGPLSAILIRDWARLETLHGGLALVAGGLLVSAGVLGWRISRGQSRAVELHGWLGLWAALAAGVASFAGFVLLP